MTAAPDPEARQVSGRRSSPPIGDELARKGRERALNTPALRTLLIRDLAAGTSHRELSEKYGYRTTAIRAFASRWYLEIEAVALDLGNHYADIWYADKGARLRAYADDIERIDSIHVEQLEVYAQAMAIWVECRGVNSEGDLIPVPANPLDASLLRVKHAALRSMAEELGQLTMRVDLSTQVRVELVGVDVEALT